MVGEGFFRHFGRQAAQHIASTQLDYHGLRLRPTAQSSRQTARAGIPVRRHYGRARDDLAVNAACNCAVKPSRGAARNRRSGCRPKRPDEQFWRRFAPCH